MWNVDQLPSPACRQPSMVAGTELDDLIVFWMNKSDFSFCNFAGR